MDALVFVSGISAVLQAIDVWITERSSRAAARVYTLQVGKAQKDADLQSQATALSSVIPKKVLSAMVRRVQQCWDKYLKVLEGGYLPDEIDEATEAVKKCICRELNRIVQLNGSVPTGVLRLWWDSYCSLEKR